MQDFFARLRRSATVKVLTIGFLILLLLIPLAMVRDTIHDRDRVSYDARSDIQRAWGQSQLIAGPVIVVPFDTVHTNNDGDEIIRRDKIYVLPETLNIDAAVESEVRYRGNYKVPVYSATIRLNGAFAPVTASSLGLDGATVFWQDAKLLVGVSDGRAIAETPEVDVNGVRIAFAPGGQRIDGFPPQIQAPIEELLIDSGSSKLVFDMTLNLKGSESLYFLPLGDSTTASISSPWPSPSFGGAYLPHRRSIDSDGFTADWKISSIGRRLPSRWTRSSQIENVPNLSCFGFELYMPISVYRLTLRAAKYGVLFIVLTFTSYFLFEVVAGLRLHPLQYLMVGAANVIFFLLLIALAEHTGFGWSYLVSALASSGLVVGYSASALGERRRAVIIGGVLLVLYVFLYMTLKAETYALLAGSLGLWAALAIIMYLTRRIDWYGQADVPGPESAVMSDNQ